MRNYYFWNLEPMMCTCKLVSDNLYIYNWKNERHTGNKFHSNSNYKQNHVIKARTCTESTPLKWLTLPVACWIFPVNLLVLRYGEEYLQIKKHHSASVGDSKRQRDWSTRQETQFSKHLYALTYWIYFSNISYSSCETVNGAGLFFLGLDVDEYLSFSLL